jgi:hypothetical protein
MREDGGGMINRRSFIKWLTGFSILPVFPFFLTESEATLPPQIEEKRRSIAESFKGEELVYEIGFWIFNRVASGRLSFKALDKKGLYMASLQAETTGLAGWISRYRMDTYRSVMEEVDGGKRLRSLSFEEEIRIGNKLRQKTHLFDYQRRLWIKINKKKDGTIERLEEEIPPGMIYDDFLTASYNFRYGVYGEIVRGRNYTIPTFPRKGSSSYEVRIAPKEEEEKRRRKEKNKESKDFFIKLFLDPEITHSKDGLIEGWLSKELYPIEGIIRDVVLFGDVRGRLINNNRA